jgi:hypothetical protein
MTLIRFVQRASILAGLTFSSLPVYGNPVRVDMSDFCITTSDNKTVCGKPKSIERACVTTRSGGIACGKFKPPTQQEIEAANRPNSTPEREVKAVVARREVNNFVYTLKGCRKFDTVVKCDFTITNKTAERNLYINDNGGSTMVDFTGKSYGSSSIDIGGKSENNLGIPLAPGIDYVAVLSFNDIPNQVTKVPLLRLAADNQTIQFRNISFSD